jgi:ppGpp synthetase/RelA/SpoT-type nucleotidyltranferase
MKVPQSVGDLYDQRKPLLDKLGVDVESLVRGHIPREWHFISRVKSRESFALKVETGRFPKPEAMEDLFACTVVVRNVAEVSHAEAIITSLFDVLERRPPTGGNSRARPETFDFDHVRLYVSWRDDDRFPLSGYGGITFEVQVKTYLQHAWAIATHDLIYKTDEVSWGKARIAAQVKAMLEHAELTITHASSLAAAGEMQRTNEQFDGLRGVIDALRQAWEGEPERLPADIRRLAENVQALIEAVGIDSGALRDDLLAERAEGRGPLIETLSPFGVVVQSLLLRRSDGMRAVLEGSKKDKRLPRIVLHPEVMLPASIDRSRCKNAIFVMPVT